MVSSARTWLALVSGLCLGHAACTAQLSGGELGEAGAADETSDAPKLPGGLKLQGKPQYFRAVRLTHAQWENSVRDVLLLPTTSGLSTTFIPDPPDGTFSNNERALYVSDTLSRDYQRGAEAVAADVAGNAAQLAQLSPAGDASGFIASVGRRAFRRTLTAEEQTAYETLWASGATFFSSGDGFADGARIFLEALLQSPYFVYRVEISPDGSRLSGVELATKISYLLRNTTPNESMLDAAEAGELDSEAGVAALVSTLLEEDGARATLETFHRELFGLDRYRSILKSPEAFPTFDDALIPTLLDADLLFFAHVFTQNLGFREILTSNVAFVNDATAGYYGLSASSSTLTQAELDGSRPGFLTRVGFLAYNANLIDPDPIHRGVDINNRLLCAQLSPPPGEIPPLPDPIPGQTNRERVAAHTGDGFCGGCHNEIINPPGFALESFDAVGQLRTTDNGKPVDTTGAFLIGNQSFAFSNIVELTSQIAENETAHSCYAAHLAEFAFARDVDGRDVALVTSVEKQSLEGDASIKAMLLSLMTSREFARAHTSSP
jgi:hypothetical protein